MTEPADTAILRSLDAADRELSAAQRARATATLEQILATDPRVAAPTAPPAPAPRRGAVRLLVAGGVGIAAAAAVVAMPIVLGDAEAFASWSAAPVELTGADRAAAVDACLVLQGGDRGGLAFDPDADASVLVAEARGGWSYVLYRVAGTSGAELQGSCLVPDDLVADPRPGQGGYFGSLARADEFTSPAPGPAVAREESHGVGAVDDELFVYAEGRAGADVVGIEVTTPTGREVEASIDNGLWAVWWPAGDNAIDNPEVTGTPTYQVTLRDGTVIDGIRAR